MCDCDQQAILETLGYSLWVPESYAINAVVINPGNSNLYVSLENGNTTIPGQTGAAWAITTVAGLISIATGLLFTWPEWVMDGGSGTSGIYLIDQAVTHDGGNYIAIRNTDDEPGTVDSGWQSFGMNSPE